MKRREKKEKRDRKNEMIARENIFIDRQRDSEI
jgi:hypothetical protein